MYGLRHGDAALQLFLSLVYCNTGFQRGPDNILLTLTPAVYVWTLNLLFVADFLLQYDMP